jgi:metal iron transporter
LAHTGTSFASHTGFQLMPQPATRRIVTRLIGVIPAAAVAAAVGQKGLNTMLVASQVLLSIILPTVIFPLVLLCSKDEVMTVEGLEITESPGGPHADVGHSASPTLEADEITPAPVTDGTRTEPAERPAPVVAKQTKSYKSPLWITILGFLLFAITVVANAYVIVQLILGNAG